MDIIYYIVDIIHIYIIYARQLKEMTNEFVTGFAIVALVIHLEPICTKAVFLILVTFS